MPFTPDVIARVILYPGGVLAWILAGLIAGAIAGRIARGRGYGCLMDIALGIVGAFVGGAILSLFVHGDSQQGFIGTVVIALLGALAVIFAFRLLRGTL